MRIRIVSDGIEDGTRIEDADTGDELEGVIDVVWGVSAGNRAWAKIAVQDVSVDITGDVEDL